MRTITSVVMACLCVVLLQAQKIDVEELHDIKTITSQAYLGEVNFQPEDQTLSLHYVNENRTNTTFSTVVLNDNLQKVDEYSERYESPNLLETLKKQVEELKNSQRWFTDKYRGEEYVEERLFITRASKGQIYAEKYEYRYARDWDAGRYHPKMNLLESKVFKGAKAERLHLYEWVQLNDEGEALLIVGIKAPKKSKIKNQEYRKFQLIKINKDFEIEYLETLSFRYNMAITFMKCLTNEVPEVIQSGGQSEAEETVDRLFSSFGIETVDEEAELEASFGNYVPLDLSLGNLVLVFTPDKKKLSKKNNSDAPQRQTLVVINQEGVIEMKENYTSPVSGWAIEDLILTDDPNEFFLYGPAKEDAYVNDLVAASNPLAGETADVKDVKWRAFQLAKIKDGEIAWIKKTDLKTFQEKAKTPPSQKKEPTYLGRKFEKVITYVTPDGEVFIGGQKYRVKALDETKSIVYKDLLLFHFDAAGKLKAQYGVRRDKMNADAKAVLTPQDLYLSADDQHLYWVYGEIKGIRYDGSLKYYPSVAKIELNNGKIGDFTPVGLNEKGKPSYFAHNGFPQVLSADGSSLIFLGSTERDNNLWVGKMKL